MMKVFYKVLIFVVVIALNGCSAISGGEYNPPSISENNAYIIFNNKSSKFDLDIKFYEESSFCKRRRSISNIPPKTESVTYPIKSSGEITFQYYMKYRAKKVNMHCLKNVRFLPEIGKTYKVISGDRTNRCGLEILDITNPSNVENISYKNIDWRSGMHENSSFCDE